MTFNYDRSLEYFWYRALCRSFGLDKEKTDRLYSCMPIIHLHGDLGLPDFCSKEGRPYLPRLASDSLRAAIDGIVIPGVDTVDQTVRQQACQAMDEADVLCFLGFAFHPANVKLLNIKPKAGRRIYVCAYRLPENEKAAAVRLILDPLEFGSVEDATLEFLGSRPILV